MDIDYIYRHYLSRFEHMSYQQMSLLMVVIVAFGIYCLRGFGSRSNY